MIRDQEYGFNVGDIVHIPYMTDIPAGYYEVNAINPLWIKDDEKGNFNSRYHDLGEIKLVCKNYNKSVHQIK